MANKKCIQRWYSVSPDRTWVSIELVQSEHRVSTDLVLS